MAQRAAGAGRRIRTGKPYAEIVLLRSLLYRVEQVFLIHRKTGLLLQYAAASTAETKDPEMVSGMLTAIQDFVQDSVSGAEGENLETVRMGDIAVVLTYGPDAILAGFVRGVPPAQFEPACFRTRWTSSKAKRRDALHEFDGDTSQFDSCRPRSESLSGGPGKTQSTKSHLVGGRRASLRSTFAVDHRAGRLVDLFVGHGTPLVELCSSIE